MSTPLPIFIPKTRKGLIILFSILFVICAAITIFVYIQWSADQQVLKEKGQPDFNTLSQSDLKDGLIVKGSIDFVLDAYAEDYNTTVGVRTSSDSKALYYLIPIYTKGENDEITFKYLITYKAEPEDFDVLEKILTNTSNGSIGPDTLTIDNAMILNLPADNKKYFDEWTKNPDIWGEGTFYDWSAETMIFGTNDKAVIESKIAPFMIDRTSTPGTDPIIMWIFVGMSGICLIILVILLLRKKPISGIINNTGDPDIMRPVQ